MVIDPPPTIHPDDRPDDVEFGRLAVALLRDIAAYDLEIAESLR